MKLHSLSLSMSSYLSLLLLLTGACLHETKAQVSVHHTVTHNENVLPIPEIVHVPSNIASLVELNISGGESNGSFRTAYPLASLTTPNGLFNIELMYDSHWNDPGVQAGGWTLSDLPRIVIEKDSAGRILNAMRWENFKLSTLEQHPEDSGLLQTSNGKPIFQKARFQTTLGQSSLIVRHPNGNEETYRLHGHSLDIESQHAKELYLLSEFRKAGNPTELSRHFSYDANSNLQEITCADGTNVTFEYQNGRIYRVQSSLGHSVLLDYNGSGMLNSINYGYVEAWTSSHPNSISSFSSEQVEHRYQFQYTSSLLSAVEHPDGARTIIGYDSVSGRLRSIEEPGGKQVRYFYQDTGASLDSSINANITTVFVNVIGTAGLLTTYNRLGLPLSTHVIASDAVDGEPSEELIKLASGSYSLPATRFEYNVDGQLVSVVRPEGNRIEYRYDTLSSDRLQHGNLVAKISHPDSNRGADGKGAALSPASELFVYDALFNRKVQHTDQENQTTRHFLAYQEGFAKRQVEQLVSRWKLSSARIFDQKDLNGNGMLDPLSPEVVLTVRPDVTSYDLQNATGNGRPPTIETVQPSLQFNRDQHGRITEAASPQIPTSTQFQYDGPSGSPFSGIYTGLNSSSGETATSTNFIRDQKGNVIEEHRPDGIRLTYSYNQLGWHTRTVVDGRILRNFYDPSGRLVRKEVDVDTPEGQRFQKVTIFRYDAAGNLISFEKSSNGSLPSHKERSQRTEFRYDSANRLLSKFQPGSVEGDPNAGKIEYQYDQFNRILTEVRDSGTMHQQILSFEYDGNGNQTKIVRPEGTLSFLYDGFDRPITIINPAGNLVLTQYNERSQVKRQEIFGSDGHSGNRSLGFVNKAYNEWGELVREERQGSEANGIYYYQRDRNNRIRRILHQEDGISLLAQAFLSESEKPEEMRMSNGTAVSKRWDSGGRLISHRAEVMTPGIGSSISETTTTYGPLGLPEFSIGDNGESSLTGWRSDGEPAWKMDSLLNVEQFVHDGERNEIARFFFETENGIGDGHVPPGNTVGAAIDQFEYDGHGKLQSVKDAAGNLTNITYGSGGVTESVTYPDSSVVRYEHDLQHRKATEVLPSGVRVERVTDIQGNIIQIKTSGGPSNVLHVELLFTYDGAGRQTSALRREAGKEVKTTFFYDQNGNLSRETTQENGVTISDFEILYRASIPTEVKNLMNNRIIQNSLDSSGRIAESLVGGLFTAQFDYLGAYVTKQTLTVNGGGLFERRLQWSDGHKISALEAKEMRTGQVLVDKQFAFEAGRTIAEFEPHFDRGTVWSFDSLGRIDGVSHFSSETAAQNELLRYRETRSHGGGGATSHQELYKHQPTGVLAERNVNGRRTTFMSGSLNQIKNYMIGKRVYHIFYDSEGRIIRKESPNGEIRFSYDALSNLTEIATNTRNGELTFTFSRDALGRVYQEESVLDGQQIERVIREFLNSQPQRETFSSGRTREFFYLNGIPAFVLDSHFGILIPHCHVDGSLLALSDETGRLLEDFEYLGAFGSFQERRNHSSESNFDWDRWYRGMRYLPEFGLYLGEQGGIVLPDIGQVQ